MSEPAPPLNDEPADERHFRPLSPELMARNSRTSATQARTVRQSSALRRAQKLWVSRARTFAYSGLADPEPCPQPVTTLALLHDLDAVLSRYLRLTAAQRVAMVLWIAHTWIVESCPTSPRLALTSIATAAGRSSALRLIAGLTPRPLAIAPTSAQSLVGLIDEVHPTLLLDDAQTWLAGNRELRRLIAFGHARDAVYLNAKPHAFERATFSCFTPCAFATTDPVPADVAKRCIQIALEPHLPHERPELLPAGRLAFEDLRRSAVRWALDEGRDRAAAVLQAPAGLTGSQAQNWRPLLAVARLADAAWVERANGAALALSNAEADGNLDTALLADVRAAFGAQDRLASDHVIKALVADGERPWRRAANGRPLDPRMLAQRLRRFGIRPRVIRTGGDAFARGYVAGDFADAFERYLPAPDSDGACVHA